MVSILHSMFVEKVLVTFLVLIIRDFSAHPSDGHGERDLSFRRLESGENSQSDEIINQCCKRESKFQSVGYGLGDGEIRVDVGQCRQQCDSSTLKPLKREEFDKFLKKYPNMDPIQIFLSLQNQHVGSIPPLTLQTEEARASPSFSTSSTSSCLVSSCQAVSTRREKHFTLAGRENEVDVIEECDCVSLPQTCQKVSSKLKVHVGTPYEKEVDIGRCLGPCGDPQATESGQFCRPVRNRTVSLEGPNGAQCMEVIDECQCVGECFRIREFYKVLDFSHIFEATTTTTNSSDENSATGEEDLPEPLTKVLDIGRCGGSCSDTQVASKCLVWSSSNGTCLSSLYGGHSKCSATKFVSHSYMDKNGQRHTLISVTGCGCR